MRTSRIRQWEVDTLSSRCIHPGGCAWGWEREQVAGARRKRKVFPRLGVGRKELTSWCFAGLFI